jgi:signal transduction histidine kinase
MLTHNLGVLDEIETALSAGTRAAPVVPEGIEEARARAEGVAATVESPVTAMRLAGLTFTAELLAASWLDRRWCQRDVDRVIGKVAEILSVDPAAARITVFLRAVRDRHVLDLPPQLGAETVLQMLCAFTASTAASLWTTSHEGRIVETIHTAEGDSSRRTRGAASESIATGRAVTSPRSQLHSLPVERWGRPAAALVFRCRPEARVAALGFAAEAAIALAPLIEFDALLGRNAARERSLTDASERRLTRLGFDLHDGPMQDIAALAADLRHFKNQLAPLLAGSEHADVALGRIDDLEARLVSIDAELRELARSLQSPAGLRVPLVEAIRNEVETFRTRSRIDAKVSASGDFDALTASQRIALVRVAQEALSNVQEHSGARSAEVRVTATRSRLALEILDDGRGFDVQQRLLEAARAGRLGLVGMGERIRLLGGRFDLESKPGGPTRVKATIPRWQPLARRASGESG